jgi:hypothetical protein
MPVRWIILLCEVVSVIYIVGARGNGSGSGVGSRVRWRHALKFSKGHAKRSRPRGYDVQNSFERFARAIEKPIDACEDQHFS